MVLLNRLNSPSSGTYWLLQGMRGILCVPALVLMVSMVGFAGLAREAGLHWMHATFMTAAIWTMPAQIIMVGSISAGLSLPAVALAVTLSSARLMPMVVALTPELRAPKSRNLSLLVLSLFVVITSWVFAMEKLQRVPRERRTLFFAGFGVTLALINTLIVAIAFNAMGHFPPLVAATLAFLTPAYFLMSLFGSARDTAGRYALFLGMAVLPIAHWHAPSLDILIAGVVGGIAAFGQGRLGRRRAAALRHGSNDV